MSLKIQEGFIAAELRWFSSAHSLISRADRQDALLLRAHDVPRRLNNVLELFARIAATSDYENTTVTADVDQCMEMADDILQRAEEIKQQRSGTRSEEAKSTPPRGVMSRLPHIQLPVFSGNVGEWTSFINLFDSLVHRRDDLTRSFKMVQLLSALHGEPKELVAHLAVTEANYEMARQLLFDCYQNKRRLVDAQLNRLFGLPIVTRISDLRTEILDPVVSVTKALENLELPAEHWSYLIVYLVRPRLPVDTQTRFEQSHEMYVDDLPTATQLIDFLNAECRRAENMDIPTKPSAEPQKVASRSPVRNGTPQRREKDTYAHMRALTPDGDKCLFCKHVGHAVTACDKFKVHRVQGRRHIVKQRGWCFLCLGLHRARDCTRTSMCPFCDGRHHNLLCMNAPGPDHNQGPSDRRGQGHLGDRVGANVQANVTGGSLTHWSSGRVFRMGTGGCTDAPSRTPRSRQTSPHVSPHSSSPSGFRRFSPPLMERPRLDHLTPPLRGRRPMVRREGRSADEGSRYPLDRHRSPDGVRQEGWTFGSPR